MNNNQNKKMKKNKNIKSPDYPPNPGFGWWKIIVAFF